jgi:hypothetical protein
MNIQQSIQQCLSLEEAYNSAAEELKKLALPVAQQILDYHNISAGWERDLVILDEQWVLITWTFRGDVEGRKFPAEWLYTEAWKTDPDAKSKIHRW